MTNICYRRSIREGGRLSVHTESIPVPQRRQVLVKMMSASVNFRDTLIAAGKNFRGAVPENMIPLSDGAGIVESVGPDVSLWKAGERVTSTFMPRWLAGGISRQKAAVVTGTTVDGVLCKWRLFDEDEIVGVPAHLSWHQAATLPCAALTAWSAINGPVPVRSGETVVVLGTGGVALFAAQFARVAGARVIVTSSSDDKLKRAVLLGASDTINYANIPLWHELVREFTGGDGADHIIETHGPASFEMSMSACRMGGQVHVIGTQKGGEIDGAAILKARVALRSVTVGSHEAFAQMNRAISLHQIEPMVDRVFAFDEAEAALTYLSSGNHFGKVVIEISGTSA